MNSMLGHRSSQGSSFHEPILSTEQTSSDKKSHVCFWHLATLMPTHQRVARLRHRMIQNGHPLLGARVKPLWLSPWQNARLTDGAEVDNPAADRLPPVTVPQTEPKKPPRGFFSDEPLPNPCFERTHRDA